VRDLTVSVQNAISADQVSPIILFEGEFASSTVRVWSGFGDLSWNSQTWIGVGTFGGISSIGETADIKANGVTISLSGIPLDMISLALSEVRQNKVGRVYMGFMDSSNDVISDPYLAFEGRLDVPAIQDDAETAVITITYESRLIDLQKAREIRYTDEEQKRLYSGDKGLEFVASLQEADIVWGKA
jgi:hypothetical protein